MTNLSRRQFLSQSGNAGLGMAAAAVFTSRNSAKAISPNEKIILGMVGIRGREMFGDMAITISIISAWWKNRCARLQARLFFTQFSLVGFNPFDDRLQAGSFITNISC